MPGLMAHTVKSLREHAITRSLFTPTTLGAAIKRLGFVQADPIRAPARAQDLILRQRVKGYRAGDLERRYPALGLEEDVLYAYGFLPRSVWQPVHPAKPKALAKLDRQILKAVGTLGETHPRQLDDQFGRKRVTNPWGGFSNQSKRALEGLHRRGLIRVARRDKGIRVYEVAPAASDTRTTDERFRELVLITANIFAPMARSRISATLAPVRRRAGMDARTTNRIVDELIDDGRLQQATVDGASYVWPGRSARKPIPRAVRFLAPFDPLVWDRTRFEHFWGWSYKFEAYTPAAKRVRGYYALPMLWADSVIGWANIKANKDDDDQLDVDVGFTAKRPTGKQFSAELDAEIERMRTFLQPR